MSTTNEALLKQAAVDVLANPRANRTASRLATGYLESLTQRQRLRLVLMRLLEHVETARPPGGSALYAAVAAARAELS